MTMGQRGIIADLRGWDLPNTIRRRGILVLSALGMLVSGYLSYTTLVNSPPLCLGVGDCETVVGSVYAKIGSVPIALLGLAMFLSIFLMGLRLGMPGGGTAALGTFSLALAGTLYSAWLTYIEFFVLRALCPWCIASALLVTGIFLLSLGELPGRT